MTTLVILVGVIMLVPLQPVLSAPELQPAFNNVVPALFGALGLKYFAKSPKIAVIPLVIMCALCIFVPSMISQTSVLMIPSGGLALAIGFILFMVIGRLVSGVHWMTDIAGSVLLSSGLFYIYREIVLLYCWKEK